MFSCHHFITSTSSTVGGGVLDDVLDGVLDGEESVGDGDEVIHPKAWRNPG